MLKQLLSFSLLFIVLGFSAIVSAQTINGTIVGTVTDPQGAVVPGANVTILNNDTGFNRQVVTDDEGRYRVTGLPVGAYTVRIEKSGFSPLIRNDVNVSVGTETEVSLSLETGQVQAQVEVTAAGELLDTTQSQITKTVEPRRILELPGRNSLNGLALLNPGVVPNQNGRPGSGFAVNGNRTRSNNFTIDGANNNDQSLSIPRQNLPPEAIAEFQIITNNPSAEFGRNAGSYVNQITRSGTNQFSGAAFYQWAGNSFNSFTTAQERVYNSNIAAGVDPYVAKRRARAVTVDNTFGGTLGGPIVRNHTFFFTSVDLNRFRTTIGSSQRGALDAASRTLLEANRNNFISPAAVDFILKTFPAANDPTLAGTTLAASTVNVTTTTGVTLPLVFRTFNRTLNQGLSYGTDFGRFLGKIDTKINDKDRLSFRYLYNKFEDPGQPASLPGLELGQLNTDQSFTINDAYLLTSTLLNEFRFTYSQRDITFPENFESFAGGAALTIGGVPGGAFAGNGNAINFPQFRNDKSLEFTDNISFTTGDHNLKFGYNLLRYNLGSMFAPQSRGTATYTSLANFLADRASSAANANGDFAVQAITYEHSFFGQDNWKVNNDLTLNLGLRYEYVTTPFGYFSNARPDINNFGPRLGFAYNPKELFGGNMVLRGGFGIAYDQVFQNILLNVSRNYPRVVNNAVGSSVIGGNTVFACVGCQFFNGFSNIPAHAQVNTNQTGGVNAQAFFGRTPQNVPAADVPFIPVRLFAPNERVKQPMSTQWNLSLQYQFANNYVFKAEYVGTKGSNLVREVEQNYGFSSILLNTPRPQPNRGSILVGQGIAESIYHSGQFTLERRLSNFNIFGWNLGDLNFNANYTYSSFISESDDVLGGQANRTIPADPRNPKLDRARSAFDIPHRFVLSLVYETPEVGNNGFVRRLTGGWQVSTVTEARSGTPFSILAGTNPLGILPSQIGTVTNSQRVSLNNPNGPRNSFTTAVVSSTGVITIPDPNARYVLYPDNVGILGNLGANTERTPSVYNTDLAVVKNIRTFGERQRLQIRAEMFNLFNRRNFTVIPTNTLFPTTSQATFLNFGLTNVGGRTFQFGARYFF
ncbi:MAG: TonB-dependent receptor [Acidobacteriota bacterium]|nr:TonB-dependent receptor [Acidobacteriota bacterium]